MLTYESAIVGEGVMVITQRDDEGSASGLGFVLFPIHTKDLVFLERARCPTNPDNNSASLLQNTIQAV